MEFLENVFLVIRWALGVATFSGVVYAIYLAVIGFLPALWRLGNGLRRRKLAIFAKGDDLSSLLVLFEDTKLFSNKNILQIRKVGDVGRAEGAETFLVHYPSWEEADLERIFSIKNDRVALILFAPHSGGRVNENIIKLLDNHRNTVLVNFRGRLLNDIVTGLITSAHE